MSILHRATGHRSTAWRPALLAAGSSLLLASCAGRRAPAPEQVAPVRYELELDLQSSLSWRRVPDREARIGPLVPTPGAASPIRVTEPEARQEPDLPPPSHDPVALALAPFQRGGLSATLGLEVSLSRRFRDGSVGWLVRFLSAEGHSLVVDPDGDELVAGPSLTGWSLAGRSIELRTFPDGQVLSVESGVHVAGPDRLGGIVDLLLPVLSPFPPDLGPDQEARRTSRWPLTVGPDRGWRHTLGATWRNEGFDTERGAWRMTWQGLTEARGRDGLHEPPVGTLSQGRAAGEVWLLDEPALPVVQRVLAHRFDFEREVEIEYPGASLGPVRVKQTQALRGTLRRAGSSVSLPVTVTLGAP